MKTIPPGSIERAPLHPLTFAGAQAKGAFRAWVDRVVDGDTVAVLVDLGFTASVTVTLRLKDVNTPEVVGAEKTAGEAARDFLRGLLPAGTPVVLWVTRTGTGTEAMTFGRYVATVRRAWDDIDVCEALVLSGHATWRTGS